MDISGDAQRDIAHNILKVRLDNAGVPIPDTHSSELESDIAKAHKPQANGYCGSCYGATPPEGGCCNSCDDVRQAYVTQGWSFGDPDAIEQVSSKQIPII
jgi:hypothetical protein